MTSYSDAGVDVAAADRFAESIRSVVTATWGENVIGRFGGFATGLPIPTGYTDPVLMMTTDGVGTKVEIARALNMVEGLGHDVVAMCVDDLAAAGAKAIGFTDYLAVGALEPDRDRALVTSIADACVVAGCPLLGGETAVHPGTMATDQFDIAGAAIGVLERAALLDPKAVSPHDVLIAIASPNLRANGFSLVRSLFDDDEYEQQFGESTLGAAVLEPSVIYAPAVLGVIAELGATAMAHITGGGLVGNIPRVLAGGMTARIDTSAWEPPGIFGLIQDRGRVADAEMFRTFNMGVGFVLIVAPDSVSAAIELLGERDHQAFPIGEVVLGDEVQLT